MGDGGLKESQGSSGGLVFLLFGYYEMAKL